MIEQAAKDYTQARRKRDEAKKALREYREQHGGCENETGPREYPFQHPCYALFGGPVDEDDWCNVCKKSQPLYLTRKKAGIKVGVTLRKLMKLCREEVS